MPHRAVRPAATGCARLVLGALALASAVPVSAQQPITVECPAPQVTARIATPLPEPWWDTPQVGPLRAVEVREMGEQRTLVCLYLAYGRLVPVMRLFPAGALDCTANRVGRNFRCRMAAEFSSGTAAKPGNACHASVQDRVAWDHEGSTRWAGANLERLCDGVTDSDQPGVCFERVMHGGVDFGGGTRWRWQNVVALCAGTRNAALTVGCFQVAIRNDRAWQDAIEQCRAR